MTAGHANEILDAVLGDFHDADKWSASIGVAPDDVLFDSWTKADVATGLAGTLVSMERHGSVSHELTKGRSALRAIDDFTDRLLTVIGEVEERRSR